MEQHQAKQKPIPEHLSKLDKSKILFHGSNSIVFIDEHDGKEVATKEMIKDKDAPEAFKTHLREVVDKESKGLTRAQKAGINVPKVHHVCLDSARIKMDFLKDYESINDYLGKPDRKPEDGRIILTQ